MVLRLARLLAGSIVLFRLGMFVVALAIILPNMRYYATPHRALKPVVEPQSAEGVVRLLQKRSALILRNWLGRGAEHVAIYLRGGRIHFHAQLGSDEPLLPDGVVSEAHEEKLREEAMEQFCPYLQAAEGVHGLKVSVVTADLSDSVEIRLYRSSCTEGND